jgi:hypothetical protein
MVTIDEAQAMLDEIAESLPEAFYNELNGGILLLPDVKFSDYARKDDLYILGEYVRDHVMGRLIYIYYGSFTRVYGHLAPEGFKGQLRETLLHEFTHHMESLAGERGLEKKDEADLQRYLRRPRGRYTK